MQHDTLRTLSVIASTAIGIAAGTNYAFSAWSVEFATKLQLSATQINLVGTCANLGMYAVGIPAGALVDRNPRWGAVLGMCLGAYFLLKQAYDTGSGNLALYCFYSFLTGVGSNASFAAAIKVSASNFPRHRGTATAFPLSGFGLSALLFTTISAFAFPDDTSGLLLLLAVGTVSTILVSSIFLTIVDTQYGLVPTDDPRKDDDEVSHHSQDIRGISLFNNAKFYKLWIMLGLLGGVGLMTINNIGNDAKALWHHYDDSASPDFIQKRQLMHVGILSLLSFTGRLLSGIGSDWLVHHNRSRAWTLVASATVFTGAQLAALLIENPNDLFWLSGLTGLAYGALYGVFPAIVVDAFGASGLASNWGAMILAPVISGFIYNIVYGAVLDAHGLQCEEGRSCYAVAYYITLASTFVGVFWALLLVREDRKRVQRERDE